ncbi:MAG: ABC transporter substrate-binding protein [Phycisphaeraceae bacterium]
MTIKRKRYCLALLVTLVGLAGCRDHDHDHAHGSNAQVTKLTLALNWVPEPEFGGFYAAQLSGAYAKHGLDVTLQPGGAGKPTMQMVGKGQVELGVVSADEILIGRARGIDVVGVFTVYQTCPQGIMVHRELGLANIGDVFAARTEGSPLTIAMEPGLPYVNYLKGRYGFDHVKVVPYSGGVVPFLASKSFAQQCFVFAEPVSARQQGADPQVFLVADAGYNPYTAAVAARGDYAKKHPELIKAFVAATQEGWQAYLDDPKPANEAMGKLNANMDARTFAQGAQAQAALIVSEDTKASGLGVMTKERWTTLAQQLVELKVIETMPAVEECFVEVR